MRTKVLVFLQLSGGDQADLNAQYADDEDRSCWKTARSNYGYQVRQRKDATTYTSTLTWELTTTPGADA